MQTVLAPSTVHIQALPTEFVESVRHTHRDAFGRTVDRVTNSSPAPCRHCLRYVPAGTPLLLLSYRPLADRNPYAEVGPIFTCAQPCERYTSTEGFPKDFHARPLVIRAYDYDGRIFDATVAEPHNGELAARSYLADERVCEVHVRNPAYGCYTFRVLR